MKRNIYYLFGIVLMLFSTSSCDYERINTNQFELTPEMGIMDGIAVGGPITAMQQCVIPVGTQADGTEVANQYQIAYNLSADVWSGYFGQNNNWNGGVNNITYFLDDKWLSASFRRSYADLYPSWKAVKVECDKSGNFDAFALAEIIKVSAWHRTTDMFGPIPYTKAGEPMVVIPYDSQEVVYKGLFKDLESSIALLTPRAEQNAKLLESYDAIYAGDVRKWVKYANSLMLRMAMRIRYVEPDLAKKYAEQAVNHSIGVMENVADEAKMERGAGLVFVNNLDILAKQYNECRMGASMLSYLVGYEDPRLESYFTNTESEYAIEAFNGKKYQAIPTGSSFAQNDIFKSFSMPNVSSNTPTYWMRASEIYFLRAEGAMLNWNMGGEAESFYKKGVETSFVESGVNIAEVGEYLTNEKEPIAYRLDLVSHTSEAPTTATTAWEGSTEEKFEKLMIQKWIALYPNGHEAWTEWRRTGYPKLHKVMVNESGGLVDSTTGIRRMRYPVTTGQSEEELANIAEAVKLLGGADSPATKLWWDKR